MKLHHAILGVTIAASFLLVAGCASPAQPDEMVPEQFSVVKRFPYTVSVTAEGGKETSALSTSEVSSEAFAAALADSLLQSGVFKRIIVGSGADYNLEVLILKVDHPMAGFNMTSSVSTSWKLTKRSTGEVVFEDLIHKEFTATMGDAFAGIKRLRLANQGAARESIAEGIHRISQLNL